ncbi:MAG TPA: outer membrane protein assembly factor BamD [Candidatus Saccharimonadales bacterium]|nr:outer membrane protein assembly factor BamD [Candidatus Saccharimonadales bacterium]
MKLFLRVMLPVTFLLAFVQRSPAPLVFTPGEGWRYEQYGTSGSWTRTRAKDQLEVAQQAYDRKDYGLALKASRRTVSQWPFSDYAPRAQYLMARCWEAEKQDERAFKAYQKLVTQYPKLENYEEITQRQFEIANRFLAGQWRRRLTYIPFPPDMDATIKMYEQIIKNGPYSKIAPNAQMNIGAAYEHKFAKDFASAAKAYEKAADRYADQKEGTDALYKVGEAYNKQAKRAEYDQSIAAQSIGTFTDFMTLHPNDARVPEAQKTIDSLKTEQARGSYDIARYYEQNHRWQGALIYYNEVLLKDPGSPYADTARQRIDAIKRRTARQ